MAEAHDSSSSIPGRGSLGSGLPETLPPEACAPAAGAVLRVRTGFGLLGVAVLLWVSLGAIPFLPLTLAEKATLFTAIVIVAEILFWIGLALLGPEMSKRVKRWFRRSARKSPIVPAPPESEFEKPRGGPLLGRIGRQDLGR